VLFCLRKRGCNHDLGDSLLCCRGSGVRKADQCATLCWNVVRDQVPVSPAMAKMDLTKHTSSVPVWFSFLGLPMCINTPPFLSHYLVLHFPLTFQCLPLPTLLLPPIKSSTSPRRLLGRPAKTPLTKLRTFPAILPQHSRAKTSNVC
jgi:hypothetical protein